MKQSQVFYLVAAVLFFAGVILLINVVAQDRARATPPVVASVGAVAVDASGAPDPATTPVTLISQFIIDREAAPNPILWSKPDNPCWYGAAGFAVIAQYDPVAHTLTVPCQTVINQPVTKP